MSTPTSTVRGLLRSAYLGDSLFSVLARGATASFGFRAGAMFLGAATQVLFVRLLGGEDYGVYTYVLGWMNMGLIVTRLQFDDASVKYVAKYTATGESGLLHGFLRTAYAVSTGLSVLGATTVAAAIWFFAPPDSSLVLPGLITCATLPLFAMTTVSGGVLQGQKQIAKAELYSVLRPLVLLPLVAVLVVWQTEALGAADALAANWIAAAATLIAVAVLVWRSIRATSMYPAEYRTREWLSTAAGMMPAALAQMALGSTTDVVFAGTYFGPEQSGAYSIAVLILSPASLVLTAVAMIVTPLVADLHSTSRLDDLRKLMKMVARINIGIAVPLVLGSYLIGPPLLSWFGPSFRAAYPVLVIMGGATLSATLGGHAGWLLMMTGHHHRASTIIGTSAIINIVLMFILAPLFGLPGVACATMLAVVLRNVMLTVSATRSTGISLLPF